MEILVKETNPTIPQYLVYLMAGHIPVECYQENSLKNKDERVINLYATHFLSNGELDLTDLVKVMSYNQFKNQN